jgi:hypothetical protein
VRAPVAGLRHVGRVLWHLPWIVKAAALVAVLSVVLWAGVGATFGAYDLFGFHPDKTTASWAGLTPRYASEALCQKCHPAEFTEVTTSLHHGVACDSCHGPLLSHALAASGTSPMVARPSGDICLTCHQRIVGRPLDFPQIDATIHYPAAGSCLQCHDAHTTVAVHPPVVLHPLTDLPNCIVCHGPQGLDPYPATHRESTDEICLGCHGAGAGDRKETSP